MTSTSSLFSSYTICSGKDKVCTVDGSYSLIVVKGSISITPSLPLSFVLHVSNFTLNLLSVSHLTKSLNCSITFFSSYCVFQDLGSRTIGRGHEDNGLYMLDVPPHSALPVQHLPASAITDNSISSLQLSQWHNRLGHPSLYTLKRLFPHLSSSGSFVFHCTACKYAKHFLTSYSISLNKSEFFSMSFILMYEVLLLLFLYLGLNTLLLLLMVILELFGLLIKIK